MTRGLEWKAWTRRLRSRFGRGASAPFGAAMTWLARRPAACTILQPVSIRVGWSWASSGATLARPLAAGAPGMAPREIFRERVEYKDGPGPRMEAARPEPDRRSARDYFVARLHTTSRLHTTLRTAAQEHRLRRSVDHVHLSETHRRVLVTDTLRAAAPRLREVFARREESGSRPAPALIASRPVRQQETAARVAEPQARTVERAVAAPTPPVAPLNVDWIASQVMEQMDRRLIAYRERLGRM